MLRALTERGGPGATGLRVVAINEPAADPASIEYLTRFDSTHGRFPGRVALDGGRLLIDGEPLRLHHAATPGAIDWAAEDIDLLLDCSGSFSTRAAAAPLFAAGAPRVLVSQPMASAAEVDATVVYGINHLALGGRERLVSNASCTTNCIVPVLAVLDAAFGIESGCITTLHSVMNDQPLIDGWHHADDLRRTRSAMQSMIPVATGLARGIDRLLPGLAGRIVTKAVRVPTLNVSALDTVLMLARDVDAAAVNAVLRAAAEAGPLAGLLAYTELPHASCDFNHDPHSVVVDGSLTHVAGRRLLGLMLWFDNEWGFAQRMLDTAGHWLARAASAAALPDTASASSSHSSPSSRSSATLPPAGNSR